MKKRAIAIFLVMCLFLPLCANAYAAIAVKKITITGGNISLKVGETKTLKVTISPSNATNKKITWKSSNTKIATVNSSGLVTAKAVGKATITATANNGKKASITVNVQKQPEVTKVTLSQTSINMLGKSVKLNATCSPSGSNQSVTWSSSNTKVATVSKDGTVTPKGYGNCKITAKSNNGKTATCSISVNSSNKITKSSVASSYNGGGIGMYKFTDTFTIIVDGLTEKIKSYDCYQTVKINGLIAIVTVKNDIKAYNVEKERIDFRSTYTLSYSGVLAKVLGLELPIKLNHGFTRYYRMDNQGNLVVTGYSEH